MDLSLSDDQRLLKDSVARFVRDTCSIQTRRGLRDSSLGFSAENWQQFARLGWLALPFSEHDGGLGGSLIDVMVLMEELGRGLALEPYLVNICVCGAFIAAASGEQRATHLPSLMAGATQWAFAFAEMSGRHDPADVVLTARRDGHGYVLNGQKLAVLNGHCADFLIVSARTSGARRDRDGISLFIVPASSAGITRRAFTVVDGTRAANITFENVVAGADAQVGESGAALALIEKVIDGAIVAIGAEAVGAMDALLEHTVAYTRTREQFKQPISKFQVLQHRMADMYLQSQATRSLLYYAAIAQVEARPDMQRAAAALKIKSGEAGRYVSQQAVQLHGGMGMTDELAIGHYFKRLLLLNTLFGDPHYHLQRYLALGADAVTETAVSTSVL